MLFNRIIKRIAEKKAGQFSKKIMLLKGAEPVVVIGTVSGFLFTLCNAMQIDISLKTLEAIVGGAIATFSVMKMIGNYLKQLDKRQ